MKTLLCLMGLAYGCLLPLQVAAQPDHDREHIEQINTYQVFYEIKYGSGHMCDYKITNRNVLTMLWSQGIQYLKTFGSKISSDPAYLIQPPFTQSANEEIQTTGKDSADYYNHMENLLRSRHDSQDQALDNLLAEIEKTKGIVNLQQIKNLDSEGIMALQLAKERFLLTTEQIQEKLVYYDLLDDKVETTTDKMLQGYLDANGGLLQGWIAPQNIQFMATTEMHLDNFREILNDTKKLTQFLAKCYGDLRATYIANLVNTSPEIELTEKQTFMQNLHNTPYTPLMPQFVKPQTISLDGLLDPNSTKYEEKLKKNTIGNKSPAQSLTDIRHQIAAHSKLAADSGSILTGTSQDRVIDSSNLKKSKDGMTTGQQTSENKLVAADSPKKEMGPLVNEMIIDSKKILAEARSDEHNKVMVIDLSGRNNRMNDTEYQVFRRSARDYKRQEEDTIFTIISKAYHRVAFPLFLLPDTFEALKSKR